MEEPAVLTDYRLTFAHGGAANILHKLGWDVHGVVMECKSEKDWQLLKDFDAGYDCIQVDVLPYGSDDPIKSNVFIMKQDEAENQKLPLDRLPQERYIRIIASGMKHHGVDEEYIDSLFMSVPYIPNRKPEEYLQFPQEKEGKRLKSISRKEYEKKSKEVNWFLVGDRIIQVGQHDPKSAFMQWVQSRAIGQPDCTWTWLQTLYDPDLPECGGPDGVTHLHQSWAENQMVDKFQQADIPATCVALLHKGVKKKSLSRAVADSFRSITRRQLFSSKAT
jgi:hypothetical protein